MKKLFILLALLAFRANAQTLSETQKLESAARIWGFLKYYHPQVAAGKFDWDEKLVELLPMVKQTKDKEELSDLYLKWIDGFGDVPACKKCNREIKDVFDKNFSMAWMADDSVFTEALQAKLKYIEQNRLLGKKYYALAGEVGELDAANEKEYKDFDYPAEHYRLLSLFRYWNIIEYFFPYKYQTDQKWDEVLPEMIPKFASAKDAAEYHMAMLELVAKIDDSHGFFYTRYTNPYFGFYWVPFTFKIIDGKAVVTDFHDKALATKDDIRIGDAITHVNGRTINDILAEKSRYIPASNADGKKRNASYAIFNGSDEKATITFERDAKTATKEITRYLKKDFKVEEKPTVDKYKVLDNNIGYVDMGILLHEDVDGMMEKLKGCDAIIFDIRNYPQGTMFAVAEKLMAEPHKFVKFTLPYYDYPGKYVMTDYEVPIGTKNKKAYKGKILLLVDETSQSHAEYTVIGLQADGRAVVVGSQTAGADGNVATIKFPGGYQTWISGIGVFYPDGRETQRIGIVPDIEVRPTLKGIQEGRDEVLEKAVEIALGK